MLPAITKRTIDNFVQHGLPPGGFVNACLENNLSEAMSRADSLNRANIFDIVQYIYNEIPAGAWGSPEHVKNWYRVVKKRKDEETINEHNEQGED